MLTTGRVQGKGGTAMAGERSAALARQIDRMARATDGSPVGFAVFDMDGRYRYVNQSLAALHRRPVAEHLGRTAVEVLTDAGLESLLPGLREVLATGIARVGVAGSVRTRGQVKNVTASQYPVRDADGTVLGISMTCITVSKYVDVVELEAPAGMPGALLGATHRHEAEQRIARLGSWEVNLATGDRLWSRQLHEMLGVDEATLAGATFGAFVHPDDHGLAIESYECLVGAGTPYKIALRMMHAAGHLLHVVCTGEVVEDTDGGPPRLWGTVRDVTEEAAERLERDAAHRAAVREATAARAQAEAGQAALSLVRQAILPDVLPSVPGAEIAVAYYPMEPVANMGGDWYDAFALPDGRLALVVGDVAGHDLRAATVMAHVRNAIRAYAVDGPDPGRVLSRANKLLMALPEVDLVTAVFAVYNPVAHDLTLARAGHPHPLLRTGQQTSTLVEPRGIALGVKVVDGPYPETTVRLGPGDALVLYTDGLVERRGQDAAALATRLGAIVSAVPEPAGAQGIVQAIVKSMITSAPLEDDTCLLVLHRPPALPTLARDSGEPAAEAG
ncbi:MAG: SpoIIE family protein phosphatase [Dactylosporangium sp.]|nr:SpoIIE family protein phosphatase [Dactylosporangium sp.]NNJ61473.1 SpoIIE family protein phosphatase [Dactylosporangium sp.]